MNQSQAKAWLPLIQAVADGKTIQTKMKCAQNPYGKWIDLNLIYGFPLKDAIYCARDPNEFRIKPEPKKAWYRIALHKSGAIVTLGEGDDEQAWQNKNGFVRWLTDRIEYELPEGEA